MTGTDTATVRDGEELPTAALAAWLSGRIPDAASLVIEQFPSGHSNLTYLLRTGGAEYVLRRPPVGPVAPRAHDMAREYRFLEAVHPHFPAAPRVVALCQDPAVIGVPFFVMERRHGVVVRRGLPTEYGGVADAAGRISRTLVDGLAALHAVDVHATGLIALGRPEGFLERQVAGWSDRWTRAQTEDLPAMTRVMAWLDRERPGPQRATVVHNDYKLDNVMLDASNPDRLIAVLDWEMATIGDPLADLGLTLTYWSLPEARRVSGMEAGQGWWTREQMVGRYVHRTGLDVSRLPWYEVLGIFKLAVIVQQIYARFVKGQTRDPRFRDLGRQVEALTRAAESRLG